MSRITVFEDGVLKLDSGAVVKPPIDPPPPPPPPPPSVGQYVDAKYTGKGNYITLDYPPGTIVCLPLPGYSDKGRGTIVVDLVNGNGFNCEICASRTKGLIDPNAGPNNYVRGGESGSLKYDRAHTPDPGPWFINLRWTAPAGCHTLWNN